MTTGPGDVVAGRYRLRGQIGGGAMGSVWLAQDERLGRDVALKQVLLPPGTGAAQADENRQLSMREARIAARLQHPHAIVVYDTVVVEGQPWLVMEYLPSRSLAEVVAGAGALAVEQTAQIGAQVADALSAAHAAGIVHRDVKPGNILIGEGPGSEGLVKITDFGIARARGDVRLTQTGIVKGTPAFLAPEVARGEEPGSASDVFSLGATLYACLEGQPPFGVAENSLKMLYRAAAGEIIPPQRSGALTRPLWRMLSGDPAQRPTMAAVRDELVAVAARGDGDPTAVLTARAVLGPALRAAGRTAVQPAVGRAAADEPGRGVPTATEDPAGGRSGWAATRTDVPGTGSPRAPADRRPGSRPAAPRPLGRRWPLVVGVLVLVALIGAGIALVAQLVSGTDGAGPGGGATAATVVTTATPAPAQPATTSAAPPASTTVSSAAPAPTTTTQPPGPTTAAPPVAAARDLEKALKSYYKQLPDSPDDAYALTGPTLQARESERDYRDFWSAFRDVQLGRVQATDGSMVVTADVTFVRLDGSRQREQHQVTFVVGDDDQLLVDLDTPVRVLEEDPG